MSYDSYSSDPSPVTPAGVFTLKRYDSGKPERNEGKLAYRLTVQVTGTGQADSAIFVYQSRVANTETGELEGVFDHVASAQDLENLPIGLPAKLDDVDYFRLDSVDLVFRKWDTLESVWLLIVDNVKRLASTIESLAALEADNANVTEE
jgi:hypothetical protein